MIEILVVVMIMCILASVGYPSYMVSVKKSRMMSHAALVKNLKDSQEEHFLHWGTYSENLIELSVGVEHKNGCSYKNTDVGSYYECPNGSRFGIFNHGANAQAGDKEIRYVQVFKEYYDNGVAFHPGDIACFSKGNVARQACKTLGGTEYKAIGWEYINVVRLNER
ncbi:MAG: prepilin-type N-terminal cleavage/methylation domain-containing protein [Elusimicrobiales bacterium]|nr:prepilin-type N-terminal cleavage/methylation domain-containing protein [Elusimicrobiales bacterium]